MKLKYFFLIFFIALQIFSYSSFSAVERSDQISEKVNLWNNTDLNLESLTNSRFLEDSHCYRDFNSFYLCYESLNSILRAVNELSLFKFKFLLIPATLAKTNEFLTVTNQKVINLSPFTIVSFSSAENFGPYQNSPPSKKSIYEKAIIRKALLINSLNDLFVKTKEKNWFHVLFKITFESIIKISSYYLNEINLDINLPVVSAALAGRIFSEIYKISLDDQHASIGTKESFDLEEIPNEKNEFFLIENLGYLKVSHFLGDSFCDDEKEQIKLLSNKSIQGWILDLRNNGGGSLKNATCLSQYFLGPKKIFEINPIISSPSLDPTNTAASVPLKTTQVVLGATQFFEGQVEDMGANKDSPLIDKLPLVVLVNARSASSSEVVAGALQDFQRGWIVGERTFGKGTIQKNFPLVGYRNIFVRRTIGSYVLPSGKTNHFKGITPDFELPEHPEIPEENRFSLREAELHPPILIGSSPILPNPSTSWTNPATGPIDSSTSSAQLLAGSSPVDSTILDNMAPPPFPSSGTYRSKSIAQIDSCAPSFDLEKKTYNFPAPQKISENGNSSGVQKEQDFLLNSAREILNCIINQTHPPTASDTAPEPHL